MSPPSVVPQLNYQQQQYMQQQQRMTPQAVANGNYQLPIHAQPQMAAPNPYRQEQLRQIQLQKMQGSEGHQQLVGMVPATANQYVPQRNYAQPLSQQQMAMAQAQARMAQAATYQQMQYYQNGQNFAG